MELEMKLKPEVEKIFGIFERNKDYIINSGIYEGKNSFVKDLDNFYDLEWVEKVVLLLRSSYRTTKLEKSHENRSKSGKIPRDLIGILEGIRNELGEERIVNNVVSNIDELNYEKIRDSFDKPIFPNWKRALNASSSIIGALFMLAGIGFSLENLIRNDFSKLVYNIPVAIGGFSLFIFYNPYSCWQEEKNFIDINTSEEAKNRNKAFWMLSDGALMADKYMRMYKEIFDF